jgi:outer membrane lipoprotein-sorting protein
MKKFFSILIFCLIFSSVAFAQTEIQTAQVFFQSISEYYGTITDYEADVDITAGKSQMKGKVSFKRPDMLRIDFSEPESQVIVFNGERLVIYLPKADAILSQTVSSDSEAGGANLATPQGLSLMNRYYSIGYENSPNAEPLDADNPKSEKVIKLILSRKNSSEGFRYIRLAISPKTKLIRRVQATSANTEEDFIFNFSNYTLNNSIPDTRFLYDTPSDANTYDNFLFSE